MIKKMQTFYGVSNKVGSIPRPLGNGQGQISWGNGVAPTPYHRYGVLSLKGLLALRAPAAQALRLPQCPDSAGLSCLYLPGFLRAGVTLSPFGTKEMQVRCKQNGALKTKRFMQNTSLNSVSTNSNYFITCKESRIENNRSFYGSFYLGPFDPGQSITIANALRRTLLSSLKGIAIVSVQIEGVTHEYSSLNGVRDSVLDILLNLKELVFQSPKQENQIGGSPLGLNTVKPFYVGYLRVCGPGVVRAVDLKLPPFIQIVDPQQYIATLAEDGFLNMKFILTEGQNYILQKQGKFLNDRPRPQGDYSQNQPTITNYKKQKSVRNFQLGPNSYSTASPFNSPFSKQIANFKANGKKSKATMNMMLSNPLMIDAIFAPVNKVNYIIEYSEHKIIDNSFYKTEELNVLFNALNYTLRPFTPKESTESPNTGQESFLSPLLSKPIGSSEKPHSRWPLSKNLNLNSQKIVSPPGLPLAAQGLGQPQTLLNTWEPTHLAEPNKFLKHNVVLEIWTNGSLHPREALYQGLKNLILLFSKLEQLQITSIGFNYERNSLKLVKKLKNINYTTTPLNNMNYYSLYTPLEKTSL